MSKWKRKEREIAMCQRIRQEIEKATAANDISELEMLHCELEAILIHGESKRARKMASKLFDPELAERAILRADEEFAWPDLQDARAG